MQNTNNVYPWEVFDSFVRKEWDHSSETESHPVLDEVARDLHTGALQSRDMQGRPVQSWQHPAELAKSYLLPSEVNARPVMKRWLMEWNPEQKSGLTPQEEVDKFGWLGALKLEEKRHRALLKAGGIRFHNTQRAEYLRTYAVKHKIRNSRGEIPSVGSIRNGVFYKAGA